MTLSPMQAHVYAGFFGGMASSVALQPLDLLKTRLQQGPNVGFANTVKSLGSLREAWRGTLPSVIRTSVGAGLYLSTLNSLRNWQASPQQQRVRSSTVLPRLTAFSNAMTSSIARAIVGFVMMPVTVVKVRYESNLFNCTSMWSAARDIVRGPQKWRGLFAGYAATLTRDAPYAGIYMLFYEKFKDRLQFEQIPGPIINAIAAVNASIVSSTLTAPFDTLKTRIQLSVEPLTLRQAFTQLTAKSWLSLFDGLSLRLARKALSSGISWCIYEEIVKRVHT